MAAFRDQLVRCGACGKDFVYTVKEQRKRAELGLSTEAPSFCAECRGADVRLAEAGGVPEPTVDRTGSDNGRNREARPRPQQRRTPDARPAEGRSGESRPRPERGSAPAEGAARPDRGVGPTAGGTRSDRGPAQSGSAPRGARPQPTKGRGKPQRGGKGGQQRKRPVAVQTELRIRHVGTVKWFNAEKGYGFIAQEDGGEVFVHVSGVLDEGVEQLEIGTPVEFEIEHTGRGPQAVDVIQLA
jgi:cold shock protein